MTNNNYRIDVHHHIVPPVYVDTLKRAGVENSMGRDFPDWSAEDAIELMDQVHIETAITSISVPGVYLQDGNFSSEQARINSAVALARECNEYSADMSRDYPGRFGFFAVLPMPLVEESLIEAAYALDKLDAHGVVLFANYCGTLPGDSRYNELMAELNRRNAVVFLHPAPLPGSAQNAGMNIEDFFLEAPVDTTRAVTNLLITGTLERYRNIKWILSHAGGTIPYLSWRLALMDFLPKYQEKMPRGVLAYLKELYYDTALSTSSCALNSLLELVDPSQVLFGSDWPFSPTPAAIFQVDAMLKLDCFDDVTLAEVERGNSLELLSKTLRQTIII
ncbi:MAG: amidohydrolase [bacterium]|nr:amidohydrolase [bacterium]